MTYALDERNSERQRLLAKVLNSLTRQVLQHVNRLPGGRCLDLGCGQGNTTRLLAEVLRPAECVGLDYDANLVSQATAHPDNPAGVSFIHGDASALQFADGAFDVVFTRYLLVHMLDPIAVIREMLRVASPGGTVIAFEPDCSSQFSYPPSWAFDRMSFIWDGLFADARIGRKLVHHFRAAGASRIQVGGLQGMEYDGTDLKRLYRLSVESAKAAIAAKGLLSDADFRGIVQELERVEQDPQTVLVKFPDVWVIASPVRVRLRK